MKEEGYMNNNLIAGYTHFHFGSSTEMVENWVEQCKAVKKKEEMPCDSWKSIFSRSRTRRSEANNRIWNGVYSRGGCHFI